MVNLIVRKRSYLLINFSFHIFGLLSILIGEMLINSMIIRFNVLLLLTKI
jgi:hypothetical protein